MRPVFFGEVVFPRSRAVDVDFGDDFDEVVPSRNQVVIESCQGMDEMPPTVKQLVLACGRHPSNFARVYLIPDGPKSSHLYTINVYQQRPESDDNDTDDQAAFPNRALPFAVMDFHYVKDTGTLIGITTSKYTPYPEVAYEIVTQILKPNMSVVVLDFKPAAMYQALDRSALEDRLSTYGIMQSLSTSKAKAENAVPQLEAPNMADGLAAGAMTYCELKEIPATMFVLYGQDSCDVVSTNIDVFRSTLERVEILRPVLQQEDRTVQQIKLASIVRQSNSSGSMFG